MQTLAQILESQESRDAFINQLCLQNAETYCDDDSMNSGIRTTDEFIAMLDSCSHDGINYKRLGEIGIND